MPNPLDKMTKLHSRLRCVANGKTEVNAVRAEQNGAVAVTAAVAKTRYQSGGSVGPGLKSLTEFGVRGTKAQLRGIRKSTSQQSMPDDVMVNVFVMLNAGTAKTPPGVRRRRGRIGIAELKLSQLATLEHSDAVQSVELGATLRAPDSVRSADLPKVPAPDRYALLNSGNHARPSRKHGTSGQIGENVLVGIIDVGGIDFAHPDFMDDKGESRIEAIWDQGGSAFPPPSQAKRNAKRPAPNYGSEITRADIILALKEAAKAKVSPYDLAPQSQQMRGSHCTHVASIAAGRSGLCKRAGIAVVLVALPEADHDRRQSFYDTTRLVDALDYLYDLAGRLNYDAVSINISLGTNGGAHDGSELVSRWIDASLTEPGRSICVAAGNAGQEAPQSANDLGYWSGRVHASGKIPAAGLRNDLEWVVPGNGIEDISENELEIWYSAADQISVELVSPTGLRIGPVGPRERIENKLLADKTVVSIYNELSDPKNGDNRISVYLSPFMGSPMVGITAGSWKVRLTGKVIRNGAFNAWIERDDPRRRSGQLWSLPSFFGPESFVDNSTLSSLACGPRVIGVANLDEARERLNVSSSQGPTRDGRSKPEIAAPGTDIVAACGFDPASQWISMTGTSMASPYVTGVAALLLSINPKLNCAQISGIIRRTSSPLPGSDYVWQDGAGYGVIDAQACLEEARYLLQPVKDLT